MRERRERNLYYFGFNEIAVPVGTLVDLWLKQDLSPGTIKNRMSCLCWLAEKGLW